MIGKRIFRIFIAISFAAGLLFVLKTKNAVAQSAFRDGRETLVDGGLLFEEFEQSDGNIEDLEIDFDHFHLPQRGAAETSGDSLPPIRIMPLGSGASPSTRAT